MKGYIYIAGRGADPALRGDLNDPIFCDVPTLGACMPNIRRNVEIGDHIFVSSGKRQGVQQYVVGGFEVDEKIDALAAYSRFPDYRLEIDDSGKLTGNIIVDADGARSPLDEHHRDNEQAFERRVQNYIIGKNAVVMETPQEVERARSETLTNLAKIFDQPPANRVIDLLGRWRRLDAKQVSELIAWLQGIKSSV